MREVRVGSAVDFQDPGRKLIGFDKFEIAVFKLDGEFFAYFNHCPHMGGPGCQGKIIPKVDECLGEYGTSLGMSFSKTSMHVVCPWHGFEFDIKTGIHPGNSKARLRKIQVRLVDGDVMITVPDDDHISVSQPADISVS